MNGYGTQFGVSYRTLHKMFDMLELKRLESIKLLKTKKLEQIKLSQSADNINDDHSTSDKRIQTIDVEDISEADIDLNEVFSYNVEVSMMEIYNEQVSYCFIQSIFVHIVI